jgi:hypothetical protein
LRLHLHFAQLKLLRHGVDLDQQVSAPHAPPGVQIGLDDAARER